MSYVPQAIKIQTGHFSMISLGLFPVTFMRSLHEVHGMNIWRGDVRPSPSFISEITRRI